MNPSAILKAPLRALRSRFPILNGLYQTLRRERYPVFVEYPVQPVARWGYATPRHPQIYAVLEQHEDVYRRHLCNFLDLQSHFEAVPRTAHSWDEASWDNGG